MLAIQSAFIAVYDFRTQTIPDLANLMLAGSGILVQLQRPVPFIAIMISMFAFFLFFWSIRTLHWRLTGRIGLGLGDVKMAAAAGAWLPISALPGFIGMAAGTALVAAFAMSLSTRSIQLTRRIPFGPFLALALICCWVLDMATTGWEPIYGF
ncbi:prepilin peptidase [Rhizobium alvei]|uniref:prepilin peptidase n=1 Tax=Rhizobium alvei TaxID=1132659 RepID=UPI00347D7EF3